MRSERRHNISEEEAERAMHATNHSRAKYHQDFTGEMWGQARYYDLTLSLSAFTRANSSPLVVDAIERWKSGNKEHNTKNSTPEKNNIV